MRKQRGLSLIELMVAMLLGLIVTGAVLQVFLSSKTTLRHAGQPEPAAGSPTAHREAETAKAHRG